ncbi:MAG TPA: 50S ribosomal protein L11 methyltransferase [Chlamydiales bacterium]|nr:50S ribosomal protein L11 methyltransferase [Chlamydiales bacterium]
MISMYNYLFQIISEHDIEVVKQELHQKGLKSIYFIEEDATGTIFIGGQTRKKISTKKAFLIEEKAAVNWEDQWSMFAHDFKEGKAHIKISDKTLLLLPGPGFGDLSHPTTQLMIEMMQERICNESVIDIGSGSGILTLAALLLDAKSAIGIEIDAAAIKHAKKNAKLNGLKAKFVKTIPKNIPPSVCLMNMILPEQKDLDPTHFNPFAKLWIVSGVLSEQKNEYLMLAKKWGWTLVKEFSRDDWMGWIFSLETL